jgi:hypothetical protein
MPVFFILLIVWFDRPANSNIFLHPAFEILQSFGMVLFEGDRPLAKVLPTQGNVHVVFPFPALIQSPIP